MVSGERGEGGKTHFMMWLADSFLRSSPNAYVYSNVIVGQVQDDRSVLLGTPPNYFFISSLADLFFYLSENLRKKGRTGKHLVILDETAAFAGSQSWFTDLSKNLVVLSTLIRKFDVCLIFSTVRAELVLKRMRETNEGLLDGRMYKDAFEIERMKRETDAGDIDWTDPDTGDEYEQRQLVVIELKGIREMIVVGEAEQLAKARERCKPGDYIYGTKQPAILELGVHPITQEKFDIAKLAMAMSKVWDDDAADKLYEYMHTTSASKVPEIEIAALSDVPSKPKPAHTKTASKTGRPSTKKGIQDEVDRMIVSGANCRDTMEATTCAERFYYDRKALLRKQGLVD